MQQSEIVERIQEIHHEHMGDDDLIMDKSFKDQGYDSLDLVEFVISVEVEYGMNVDDKLIDKIVTPNDAVELIMEAHKHSSPEKASPASA